MGFAFLVVAAGWIFVFQKFIFRPVYNWRQANQMSQAERDHEEYGLSAQQRGIKKFQIWAAFNALTLAIAWFGSVSLLKAKGLPF